LKGKTLGVIGTGRIGVEVLKIGKGFGMELVAYDVFRKEEESRRSGFPTCRFPNCFAYRISYRCIAAHPGDEAPVGPREFAGMKEGSVLVNTARGAVIDTDALVAYISRFRGVALTYWKTNRFWRRTSASGISERFDHSPHRLLYGYIPCADSRETERLITEYESSGKEDDYIVLTSEFDVCTIGTGGFLKDV
jgi:hypothetical protein